MINDYKLIKIETNYDREDNFLQMIFIFENDKGNTVTFAQEGKNTEVDGYYLLNGKSFPRMMTKDEIDKFSESWQRTNCKVSEDVLKTTVEIRKEFTETGTLSEGTIAVIKRHLNVSINSENFKKRDLDKLVEKIKKIKAIIYDIGSCNTIIQTYSLLEHQENLLNSILKDIEEMKTEIENYKD